MNYIIQPHKIERSKRKTIALLINKEAELIVKAPLRCRDEQIAKFISANVKWILNKQQEAKNAKQNKIQLINGEIINIMGKEYRVELTTSTTCKLCENKLIVPEINSRVKFITFLKKLAKLHITNGVNFYCAMYNLTYKKITITSAKTRWGSCSANNALNFTYKLIFCPEQVIDYVVVHELCHTKQKNHSRNFWQLVEQIMPQYKNYRKWLKQNRMLIDII